MFSSTLEGRFYQSTLFVYSLLRGNQDDRCISTIFRFYPKYVEVDGEVDTRDTVTFTGAGFKIFWGMRGKIGLSISLSLRRKDPRSNFEKRGNQPFVFKKLTNQDQSLECNYIYIYKLIKSTLVIVLLHSNV